ncbi:MAG: MBL fold metallo-hydrolase [Magnetococcales bacterium]|nr:MBL fold metallo-hydrolase [Magnetococcales bacterium]
MTHESTTMKICILGSGTGVPMLERSAPAYFLQCEAGEMLIDCGPGTLRQLLRISYGFENLTAVWMTHVHGDHMGELIPMMHAFRFPDISRTAPLIIYGPPGFSAFYDRVVRQTVGDPSTFELTICELVPDETVSLGRVQVRCAETVHSSRFVSLAYRFEIGGKAVVFSGDCDLDPAIVQLAEGAHWMVIDCSSLDAGKISGHLSAGECGKLAQKAGVESVVLSHLYPIPGDDAQRLEECRRHYSGRVVLAEDLAWYHV